MTQKTKYKLLRVCYLHLISLQYINYSWGGGGARSLETRKNMLDTNKGSIKHEISPLFKFMSAFEMRCVHFFGSCY
jgi:hypothetical protein